MSLSVNEIWAAPNLHAVQHGEGQQLDVSGGRPVHLFAIYLATNGNETGDQATDTIARWYNGPTNSGDYLELQIRNGVAWAITLDFPGGGLFYGNGLTIDMVDNKNHSTNGWTGWAHAFYKLA